MNFRNFKKYERLTLTVGAILLALSIICFIFVSIILGNIESQYGYRPSAAEAKEMLEQAESMAKMLGGNASDLIGMSGVQMFLSKMAITLRIPLLVVGIIVLIGGIAIHILSTESETTNRARAGLTHGISSASAALKGSIDKATSKCPRCGRVCSAKTAFCPSCGEKMVKPEAIVHYEKPEMKVMFTCPVCKKEYSERVSFCSACGNKMPEEAPREIRCPNCDAINNLEARFCSKCGTRLGGADLDKTIVPSDKSAAKETVPVLHVHVHDKPSKPSIEVVTEKNPFMSKPKEL